MENAPQPGKSNSSRASGWRGLTALGFVCALGAIVLLLVSDGLRHLQFNAAHQHAAAWPLIFIGLSYISLQFILPRGVLERVQGLLLGLAFVLWGVEQLMAASRLVTIMDASVVTIFVVDLSLIIFEHLQRRDHEVP